MIKKMRYKGQNKLLTYGEEYNISDNNKYGKPCLIWGTNEDDIMYILNDIILKYDFEGVE